jgi:hypothetical protein
MEAVRVARDLANTCPDSFGPILATSLLNLGVVRSQMGNRSGALAALAEAEGVARSLVQSHPSRHEHTLAIVLVNRANVLASNGDVAGSVEAGEEAALLLRAVNAAANGIFVVEEVANLAQLVEIYINAGNWTSAAEAARSYFGRKEEYPEHTPEYREVINSLEPDTEIARHLAKACLEMHGPVDGLRRLEAILRKFPQALQQVGPLDVIFEQARHAKTVAKRRLQPIAENLRSAER